MNFLKDFTGKENLIKKYLNLLYFTQIIKNIFALQRFQLNFITKKFIVKEKKKQNVFIMQNSKIKKIVPILNLI